MSELPVGAVTILLTDIQESTRLWEESPVSMAQALAMHDALLPAVIGRFGGVVVKHRGEGDSLFAVFERATDAVLAACSIQQELLPKRWSPELPLLRVRMAVHTGEALLRDGDYYGPVVNRCARLRAVAHGGQILLSSAAAELVRENLRDGVRLKPLGAVPLRGLSRPESVFQLLHPELPSDFPPPPVPATNHLPSQLTSFVGREQEMEQIRNLLANSRLVTLTGAGGCGKTRLALETGSSLSDLFPDGVWFVELVRTTEPALLPGAVAAALSVREDPDRPLRAALVETIGSRHALLILDNCEHLISACADLAHSLLRACPNLRIVATSREPLGLGGETIWSVPPLGLPPTHAPLPAAGLMQYDSLRLFEDRAASVSPGFRLTDQSTPIAAQICRRLDGIPLAIELAAARTKLLTVEQIAARLDDRFQLLTNGKRAGLPHHQTLRATVDWSYELLSEPERTLWNRLAVFIGSFPLEAVESICTDDAIEPGQMLDLLSQLVEKSVVLTEASGAAARYRLLETIRQYGLEKLRQSGQETALRRRHRDWYANVAVSKPKDLPATEWRNRLGQEYDNLREALRFSLETAESEAIAHLSLSLGDFWLNRGHLTEGREWLSKILQIGETLPAGTRLGVLYRFGNLARRQGDHRTALETYQEGLETARRLAEKRYTALFLSNSSIVFAESGDFAQARTLCQEALAIYRELGNTANIAANLNNLGEFARGQGDIPSAISLYEEALSLLRVTDHHVGLGHALVGLGTTLQEHGEPARAEPLLREALRVWQELHDPWGIATSLNALAGAAARQGRFESAARLLGASETLLVTAGATLDGNDRAYRERCMAATQNALGESAFAELQAQGRKMSADEAVALALNPEVSV